MPAEAPTINPSDTVRSAVQELAASMTAIRSQWAAAKGEDLDDLFKKYDQCFSRLKRLRLANLRAIDDDPEIGSKRVELMELVAAMQKATREMKSVKKAIDLGVTVLGYVDRIIKIVAKFL